LEHPRFEVFVAIAIDELDLSMRKKKNGGEGLRSAGRSGLGAGAT
jgi:hypothetical protein